MADRLPWVVPEYCEGCTVCVAACPRGALAMRAWDEDSQVPWLDEPDMCTGCGRCEEACPFGGIQMTSYVDEAEDRFRTRLCASESRSAASSSEPLT